jgi:hypothetical protein
MHARFIIQPSCVGSELNVTIPNALKIKLKEQR